MIGSLRCKTLITQVCLATLMAPIMSALRKHTRGPQEIFLRRRKQAVFLSSGDGKARAIPLPCPSPRPTSCTPSENPMESVRPFPAQPLGRIHHDRDRYLD